MVPEPNGDYSKTLDNKITKDTALPDVDWTFPIK